MLKEIVFRPTKNEYDVKRYHQEKQNIKTLEKITKILLVDSFIDGRVGFIITSCFDNAISWNNVLKKNEKLVIKNLILQINQIHKLGYIHGDVVPKNILVSKSGKVAFIDLEDMNKTNKISDFVHEVVSIQNLFTILDEDYDEMDKQTYEHYKKNKKKFDRYQRFLLEMIVDLYDA